MVNFNLFFWRKKTPIPKERLGCKKEPFMKEDYKLEEVLKAVPIFDWQKGYDVENDMGLKIIIKDQGSSGSCVGQAWAYYAGVLEAFEIGIYREKSARWIYSQVYLPDGGAYSRDGAQILTNQGIVPIALFPDKKTESEMRNRDDVKKDLEAIATVYLKSSYLSLPINTIDYLASVIKLNKGFVGGVFDGFDSSWRTAFPKPSSGNNGHAMYFAKAKLINGQKYIGSPNSWGDDIGDKGWQWFGQEWLTRIFFPKTIRDLKSEIYRKPEFHYCFNQNLKWGMRNNDVVALQEALKIENCFPTNTDSTGYFGGITLKAVIKFQEKYIDEILRPVDLEKGNGFVGKFTRKKLNQLFCS